MYGKACKRGAAEERMGLDSPAPTDEAALHAACNYPKERETDVDGERPVDGFLPSSCGYMSMKANLP